MASGANQSSNDQFDIKIDHRFSQNEPAQREILVPVQHGNGLNCFKNFTDPCQGGPGWTNAHLFAVNETHTFSPTLLMNVTLGFTRGVWHIDAYNPQGVDDPLSELGFPVVSRSPTVSRVCPTIYLDLHQSAGSSTWAAILTATPAGPGHGTADGHARQGIHESHELKFGFDGRIHQINYIQTNAAVGIFSFDENGSSSCPTA